MTIKHKQKPIKDNAGPATLNAASTSASILNGIGEFGKETSKGCVFW